jgi:hypothetical protein
VSVLEEVREALASGRPVSDDELLICAAQLLRGCDELIAALRAQVAELTAENVELVIAAAALRYKLSRRMSGLSAPHTSSGPQFRRRG